MINVAQEYESYCRRIGLSFETITRVNPYDDTTLFCPAGMQQFKSMFRNKNVTGTLANIQSCIRVNDWEDAGDGTHLLHFNMMGLFSFRYLSFLEAINFWLTFMNRLGVKVDTVTYHPEHSMMFGPEPLASAYERLGLITKPDRDCYWSDGDIGGYCNEFYVKGIEIGNIVNPLGTCIDVGFGLERLDCLVNNKRPQDEPTTLRNAAMAIINSGYVPSNVKQGYVLRRILRRMLALGYELDHSFFSDEKARQQRVRERYETLKDKYPNQTPEWWWDTHGIKINEL